MNACLSVKERAFHEATRNPEEWMSGGCGDLEEIVGGSPGADEGEETDEDTEAGDVSVVELVGRERLMRQLAGHHN